MPAKRTLTWMSRIFAVMLLGFIGGLSADQAFAQDHDWQLGVPVPLDLGGPFQVIQSMIGDFDCFGYPSLMSLGGFQNLSPCGALPGPPTQGAEDDPQTDILLDCTLPDTVTFTHSFTPPTGTILGALWLMNIGGIDTSKFPLPTVKLDVPATIPLPNTGALGTTLVAVPILPPHTAGLLDGTLVVTITRGATILKQHKCTEVFVDFSDLIIVASTP